MCHRSFIYISIGRMVSPRALLHDTFQRPHPQKGAAEGVLICFNGKIIHYCNPIKDPKFNFWLKPLQNVTCSFIQSLVAVQLFPPAIFLLQPRFERCRHRLELRPMAVAPGPHDPGWVEEFKSYSSPEQAVYSSKKIIMWKMSALVQIPHVAGFTQLSIQDIPSTFTVLREATC